MSLHDFTQVFGPGQLFDRFIQDELQGSADVEGASIKWKQLASGVDPSGLSEDEKRIIQKALEIKRTFFPNGQLRFEYSIEVLKTSMRRVDVTIDGKAWSSESKGEIRNVWPGQPSTTASVRLVLFPEEVLTMTESGPWAL